MLTGVEVAGIVLAVLPLCIKMIALYEDEMEPFASLFAYRSQLSKRKKELYCVHVSFTKTIQNLCHSASVADSEQFDEMVKGSTALSWQENDSERKLQQFLSLPSYEAYKIKAVMICDSMMKLAGILGLDKEGLLRMEGMQGFRSDPWAGVACAKLQVQSKPQPTHFSRTLKKRLKLVFQGGEIGPLLQKVKDGTRELDEIIGKSVSPHAIPLCVTINKRKEPFSRPLDEIKDHACRLHRALHGVWSCPDHPSHCVNLRLEKRIRRDGVEKADQAPFTIAMMQARKWCSFQVNVSEEPVQRPRRAVNFDTTANVPSGHSIIEDFCKHANVCNSCLPLHLDHKDQFFGDRGTQAPASADATTWATVTLKELLGTSMRSETKVKQCIQLALTLVSSFLQLQSTPWLPNCWYAEDVILLRSNKKLDIERPFIRQVYPPSSCTVDPCPSDSDRILALGLVLLQIVELTPIDDWRTATNAATPEDLSIMMRHLHEDAQIWPPCFAESIRACWNFLGRSDLDLNEPTLRKEMIENMLYPFQRDLKW